MTGPTCAKVPPAYMEVPDVVNASISPLVVWFTSAPLPNVRTCSRSTSRRSRGPGCRPTRSCRRCQPRRSVGGGRVGGAVDARAPDAGPARAVVDGEVGGSYAVDRVEQPVRVDPRSGGDDAMYFGRCPAVTGETAIPDQVSPERAARCRDRDAVGLGEVATDVPTADVTAIAHTELLAAGGVGEAGAVAAPARAVPGGEAVGQTVPASWKIPPAYRTPVAGSIVRAYTWPGRAENPQRRTRSARHPAPRRRPSRPGRRTRCSRRGALPGVVEFRRRSGGRRFEGQRVDLVPRPGHPASDRGPRRAVPHGEVLRSDAARVGEVAAGVP